MMAAMLVSPSSPLLASQPFLDRSFHQAAPSKTCLDTNKRRSIKISALRRDDYSDKLIREDMIMLEIAIMPLHGTLMFLFIQTRDDGDRLGV